MGALTLAVPLVCAAEPLSAMLCRGIMGLRLADLIDSGAQWILTCNFTIDADYLLSECPNLFTAEQLVFVHGMAGRAPDTPRW